MSMYHENVYVDCINIRSIIFIFFKLQIRNFNLITLQSNNNKLIIKVLRALKFEIRELSKKDFLYKNPKTAHKLRNKAIIEYEKTIFKNIKDPTINKVSRAIVRDHILSYESCLRMFFRVFQVCGDLNVNHYVIFNKKIAPFISILGKDLSIHVHSLTGSYFTSNQRSKDFIWSAKYYDVLQNKILIFKTFLKDVFFFMSLPFFLYHSKDLSVVKTIDIIYFLTNRQSEYFDDLPFLGKLGDQNNQLFYCRFNQNNYVENCKELPPNNTKNNLVDIFKSFSFKDKMSCLIFMSNNYVKTLKMGFIKRNIFHNVLVTSHQINFIQFFLKLKNIKVFWNTTEGSHSELFAWKIACIMNEDIKVMGFSHSFPYLEDIDFHSYGYDYFFCWGNENYNRRFNNSFTKKFIISGYKNSKTFKKSMSIRQDLRWFVFFDNIASIDAFTQPDHREDLINFLFSFLCANKNFGMIFKGKKEVELKKHQSIIDNLILEERLIFNFDQANHNPHHTARISIFNGSSSLGFSSLVDGNIAFSYDPMNLFPELRSFGINSYSLLQDLNKDLAHTINGDFENLLHMKKDLIDCSINEAEVMAHEILEVLKS